MLLILVARNPVLERPEVLMEARKFLMCGIAVAASLCIFTNAAWAKELRVCADPNYLPFSNHAGEGFENKIAETVAKALGETVEYTWQSYRGHGGYSQFLASTLDQHKCDVVMDIPYGSQEELTTRPYYISSYIFVFKKDRKYDITSMDSPALRTLKVGFERGTPVQDGIKLRGMVAHAVPFDVGDNEGESPEIMLKAVEDGRVDVMITWQPAIGRFLREYPDLEVVAVPNTRSLGSPEQYTFPMSMGVRKDDDALKRQLDAVIAQHKAEIKTILDESGVSLYVPQTPNVF